MDALDVIAFGHYPVLECASIRFSHVHSVSNPQPCATNGLPSSSRFWEGPRLNVTVHCDNTWM